MSTALCQLAGCVETPIPLLVGSQTVGAVTDSGDSNALSAQKLTAPQAGVITAITVRVGAVDAPVANRQWQAEIYSDVDGPSEPFPAIASGTLVANSWNTAPLSVPLAVVAGQAFWVVYNTNGRTSSVNNLLYDRTPTICCDGGYSGAAVPFGTWPSPFPAWTTGATQASLYVTLGPR